MLDVVFNLHQFTHPPRPIIHHQRPSDGINSERARTRDGTFNLFSCALGMVPWGWREKKHHPAIFRKWRVKRTAQKKSLKLDDSSADVAQDVLGMTAAFCNLPGVLQCERWSISTDPLKYLVLPHLLDPVSTKFDNSVWENNWPSHSQTTWVFGLHQCIPDEKSQASSIPRSLDPSPGSGKCWLTSLVCALGCRNPLAQCRTAWHNQRPTRNCPWRTKPGEMSRGMPSIFCMCEPNLDFRHGNWLFGISVHQYTAILTHQIHHYDQYDQNADIKPGHNSNGSHLFFVQSHPCGGGFCLGGQSLKPMCLSSWIVNIYFLSIDRSIYHLSLFVYLPHSSSLSVNIDTHNIL